MSVDTSLETVNDAQRSRLPSLSPSRAGDFKTCPLLYRFRTIDRLPERPTPDQARGTLVHAVLERLFDVPAPERTPEQASALIEPEWARLVAERSELVDLFSAAPPEARLVEAADRPAEAPAVDLLDGEPIDQDGFLASAKELLSSY